MGYPTIGKFDINFIRRTQENINSFNEPNSFTHRINSLLGLIFLPHEFNNKGKRTFKVDFLNRKISEYESLTAIFSGNTELGDESGNPFTQEKFYFKSGKKDQIRTIHDTTIKELIRLFRNGIAHSNITPVADGDSWRGIIVKNFQNSEKEKANDFNFETYLTQKELRIFSDFIADEYLKNIDA